MKYQKNLFWSFAGILLITQSAVATPITFSGASGAVSTDLLWSWGKVGISADLLVDDTYPGLTYDGVELGDTTIDVGESLTFDFFEVEVTGWGLGAYAVEASLSFEDPQFDSGASGGGAFFTFGGVFSGGTLSWSPQPDPVYLSLYDSWLGVSFEEGVALGFGNSKTIHATVTNLGGPQPAPVPEPATMLLFGSGLAALLAARKRK